MPSTPNVGSQILDVFEPAALPRIGTPGLPGASGNDNPLSISNPTTAANNLLNPTASFQNVLDVTDKIPVPGNIMTGPLDSVGNAISATGAPSYISDLFLRGTIIILGFIFVAVGLSMFNDHKIIIYANDKANASKEAAAKAALAAEKAAKRK